VTALLDFTLYSFPFSTHLGPLDLYLDSHRSIANTHGSPLHYRNTDVIFDKGVHNDGSDEPEGLSKLTYSVYRMKKTHIEYRYQWNG